MAETKYFKHTLPLSDPFSTSPSSTDRTIAFKLAYQTYGASTNPAILIPTCYGGHVSETFRFLFQPTPDSLVSPPISTERYFIILTGLLGGSESSSPSNTPVPHAGTDFPPVSYAHNIALQHALLTQGLGVTHLHAYIGFSMGAQQAYHMAILYPTFVSRIVCLAGSARTSWHNFAFLEGPKAALKHSSDFHEGRYVSPAKNGTAAFARAWAAWGPGYRFFNERCWEGWGFDSLEAYLDDGAINGLGAWDANDLLCMADTWQKGDIGKYHPQGLEGALREGLMAKVLVMPCRTDQYFRWEDSDWEVKMMGEDKARLRVIESIYGHFAGGGGGTKEDNRFICEEIKKFLGE